jgi:hypothetical protein
VDDTRAAALEQAIADLGELLVQMDKFRARRDEARALRTACLAIGDRARRAHRHGALDAALATELEVDTAAARAALDAWLASVRSGPPYRAAVASLAAGDRSAATAALADVFDDVRVVLPPAVLYHPVAWQRRGRPRPAAELVDELVRLRSDGLPGDDDPAAPGVDPALPAVRLHTEPPLGAPIHLVVAGAMLPSPVLLLGTTGDVLVPGPQLAVPFAVGLADPDDEDLDAWALDPAALRRDLADALAARGIPLAEKR